MSLFERIQNKLLVEETTDDTEQTKNSKNTKNKSGSASTGSGTDYSNTSNKTGNKKFKRSKFAQDAAEIGSKESKGASSQIDPSQKIFAKGKNRGNQQQQLPFDYSKTGKEDPVKDVKTTKDIIGNRKKQGRPFGSKNRPKETNPNQQLEIPFDDGKKKRPPRKGVDYFFDAEKAKKERDAFQQGRKAYTDSKSGIKAGKVTKKGIIDYITKARNMKQGTNANAKANRKAAEIIAKSSGSEYARKIRDKYETDKNLSRRRGKNQPSYAEVKKGQPKAKTMTYLSPAGSGKPVPLKTRRIKKKIIVPPETKPVKQFDGKSFDDFIKDTKKKSKKALQDVKNIKVDPVTKFGSKVSVGNQIPYVSPPPLKDPLKGLKFKKARAVVPKNKTLRAIQRAARKNPRLALAATILGSIGTVAIGNRLRNPKSGIGAGGTGKKDPLVANVKATYFLDPKKTQFSVDTSKNPSKPNYRVLENPKFAK